MGAIADSFAEAFRNFVTDGVPASGAYRPDKALIRALGLLIEAAIGGVAAGIEIVATTAARDAFYATPENRNKLVYVNNNNGSATDPANGVYEYVAGAPRIAQGFYAGLAVIVQPLVAAAQAAADASEGYRDEAADLLAALGDPAALVALTQIIVETTDPRYFVKVTAVGADGERYILFAISKSPIALVGPYGEVLTGLRALVDQALADAAQAKSDAATALAGVQPLKVLMERSIRTTFLEKRNPFDQADIGLSLSQSATQPTGLTKEIGIITQPSKFRTTGGDPVTYATNYQRYYAVTRPSGSGNMGGVQHASYWTVTSRVDAANPAFWFFATTAKIRVMVDGQWATPGDYVVTTTSAKSYLQLNFGSRKVRTIKICSNGNMGFGGWALLPSEDAWAPIDIPVRMTCVGDSWGDGTGSSVGGTAGSSASGTGSHHGLAAVASRLAGFDLWNCSIGGTGPNNPNGAEGNFYSSQRIADVLRSDPDLLVLFGSINDSTYTTTECHDAALACYTAYRAALGPDVPIIHFGMPGASTGPSQALIDRDAAYAQAWDDFGDDNGRFVRLSSNVVRGPWINGTGRSGAPNGTGNADLYMGGTTGSDVSHPTPAGHEFVARNILPHLLDYATAA